MSEDRIGKQVASIWRRARINAFAHRRAAESANRWQTLFVIINIILALSAIFFVVIYYVHSERNILEDGSSGFLEDWGRSLILASITSTILGVGSQTLQIHFRFGVRSAQHRHCLGSYQYIAQRSREIEWPDMSPGEMGELVRDLERDFQLLKARGFEPSDTDFDEAARIFKKIQDDEIMKSAQSF